ncbi:MAG TPA: hypothetical protein DDY52_03100 [Candidatus Moranbacteria bacterium]|nr:hypothetical protein [Candidatus Moranbacteria bacterium]
MLDKCSRIKKFVLSFTAKLLNVDEDQVTLETVVPDVFLLTMFFIKTFPEQKPIRVIDNVEEVYTVKKAIEIFER